MTSAFAEPVRKTHRSKRDLWLVAVFWAGAVLMHAGALAVALTPCPLAARIAIPISLIVASDVTLWSLYGTRYLLTDFELRIVSGPFRWRLPYDHIEQVHPSRSIASGPACSTDRLEVVSSRPSALSVLISPERKLEFLSDLVLMHPSLRLLGDRVVRAETA